MSLTSPFGVGFASILHYAKPLFIWSPSQSNSAIGDGYQGGGRMNFVLNKFDSTSSSALFCVWHDGKECFEVVSPDENINNILGHVGDFSDGSLYNAWPNSWTDGYLGFSQRAPYDVDFLNTEGFVPDIIDGYHGNVMSIDTNLNSEDVVIQISVGAFTYDKTLQFFLKSVDGYDPKGENVFLDPDKVLVSFSTNEYESISSVSDRALFRQLPGTKGWWSAFKYSPASVSSIYIAINFKAQTGKWYLVAPFWYNVYSTFEHITRAPTLPLNSRSQYGINTENDEIKLGRVGWLGVSFVLPDRSVSNGHQDVDGSGNYRFTGLVSLSSGNFRIRIYMSSSRDHLVLQMDESGSSFAFLDFPDDWDDFEKMGAVLTWGFSSGQNHAYLYVNGRKLDSKANATNWYPETLSESTFYIGTNGYGGGGAADCWISKVAYGKRPLDRNFARTLSIYFRDIAKGGRIGSAS